MRPNAARRGRTLAIAGLLILSLAPAHVAAAEADPRFKVAKEELLQRLKTIAVEPTTVSTELPGAAAVAARIDQGVADWLTLAGYEVVPASEMRPIEARLNRSKTLPKYDITILPKWGG